jgi:hypothetical protein
MQNSHTLKKTMQNINTLIKKVQNSSALIKTMQNSTRSLQKQKISLFLNPTKTMQIVTQY